MSSAHCTDQALRTMCDEGNFRILIADTTKTVSGILEAQRPDEATESLLADLVTASILLRLTMSPDYRLQAILQNKTTGTLLSDSHPDGITRGLVQRLSNAPIETGDATYLSIHRSMFGGDVHQGVVETGERQRLADAVSGYLHRSEQVTSVVDIGHRFADGELDFSGGYIVQLLPQDDEIDKATLALMTARLQNLPGVAGLFADSDGDLEGVAETLFGPIDFNALGSDDFHCGCICSVERVMRALETLSDDDIEELSADGDTLEVDCDYCGAIHQIEAAAIQR